jgi:hypothetical protein
MKTADLDVLADGLRARGLDMGWETETVLRSHIFFADKNLGDCVPSPAEYILGAARDLELFEPPCSTRLLTEYGIAVVAFQSALHQGHLGIVDTAASMLGSAEKHSGGGALSRSYRSARQNLGRAWASSVQDVGISSRLAVSLLRLNTIYAASRSPDRGGWAAGQPIYGQIRARSPQRAASAE